MDQLQLALLDRLSTAISQSSEETIAEILASTDWPSLLTQKAISECRIREKTPLVIFLCTLATHNEIEPELAQKWLQIYQSIQSGQLSDGIATDSVISFTITAIHSHTSITSASLNAAKGLAQDWLDSFELALDFRNWKNALQILSIFSRKSEAKKYWDKFSKILSQRHNHYVERQTRLPSLNIDYSALSEIYRICQAGARKANMTDIVDPLIMLEANVRELAGDFDKSITLIKNLKSYDDYFLNLYDIARCQCRKGDLTSSVKTLDRSIEKLGEKISLTSEIRDLESNEGTYEKNVQQFNVAAASIALSDLISILGKHGVKGFLVSGTLLGYAREGGILEHDKDIDIGVIGWEKQYDVYITLQESGQFILHPSFLKGHRMFYLPIRHKLTGISIDVFFYHETDGKLVTGVDFVFGYQQKFAFTPFDLTTIRFLNVDMYIPKDYDLNLRENFGKWKIPDASYISHLESPSTIDKGNIQYMLTARITTLNSMLKRQPSKLFKIATLMETQAEKPFSMTNNLIKKIRYWAENMSQNGDHAQQNRSTEQDIQHA